MKGQFVSIYLAMLVLFMAIPISLLNKALIAIMALEDSSIPVDAHMVYHIRLLLRAQVTRRAGPHFVHATGTIVPLFLLYVPYLLFLLLFTAGTLDLIGGLRVSSCR